MKTGVIVVTHGDAAAAMIEAAERVVGKMSDVRALGIEVGEATPAIQRRIEHEVTDLGVEEVLFLVDLGGSTPANLCCRSCAGRSVVLSGLNMPMLFKLATADRAQGARHLADELAQTGHKSIAVQDGVDGVDGVGGEGGSGGRS
jgi:PTS system mannose-specific IIB component